MPHRAKSVVVAFTIVAIMLVVSSPLWAQPETIGIGELQPGMNGYGLTVFKGLRPERFQVRLLNVVNGPWAGRRTLLIEVVDRRFDSQGQIFGKGFSGSPIYFKDRLAGAVSYVEKFQTDKILGVTPIDDMLEEFRLAAIDVAGDETHAPRDVPSEQSGPRRPALEPGSMISIAVVRGDFWFNASGTVTAVLDDKILAFGHENLFWGDSVSLPMHRARVEGIVAKADVSRKVATALEEIGSVVWDGKGGIIGSLGTRVLMIPVTASYQYLRGGEKKEYHAEMVRHTAVVPAATKWLVSSMMENLAHRRTDPSAVAARLRITLRGVEAPVSISLRLDNTGASWSGKVSPIEGVLKLLFAGNADRKAVEAMDIAIEELTDGRAGRLKEAYFGRNEARPGDRVTLYVVLEHSLEERMVVPIELRIPPDYPPGQFPVAVVSGASIWPTERLPRSNREIVVWLNGMLRSDDLVVLHPGDGSGPVHYSEAGVARTVKRVPWSVVGEVEAGITVKGSE